MIIFSSRGLSSPEVHIHSNGGSWSNFKMSGHSSVLWISDRFHIKKEEKEVNVNEKNGLVELSNDTSRVEFHSLRLKRKKDEWRPDLRLQRLHLTSNSKRSTKKIDRPSH